MPAVNPCPEQYDYQRLIHGELTPSDVERFSQHLESCPSCAAAVQTLLGEDTLLSAIRGTPVNAPSGSEVPADLTLRLLALPAQSSAGTADLTSLLAPSQGPDEIGRLAYYRVLKVLGAGGMGVVFLAEDVRLGRTVALKTMKPDIAADPRYRQRFLREARAAAKVVDDHIVPIYDVGEERGVAWLAMPFLKGQSLGELLKRVKVLKPAQAVRIGAQVAKGLAAAHAAGLIHRDIKPANIWIEPEGGGRARLLDFGLARDQSPLGEVGQERLTHSGAVVGTPAFMAPEQARGEPLDARADLFSLGCVLYRAVTGRLPFQGQGAMGTLLALATETPPAPKELNPDVSPPLSALIMNLLAKERSARLRSAALVVVALEAIQEKPASPLPVAKPVAIPPAPRRDESNPWADLTEVAEQPAPAAAPRRRWRQATAAALLLALGGALAAGIVVIIKNKDGKEVARVTVPEGGSVETKKDGDSGREKGDPAETNPDRRAAKWVLSIGGTVYIRQDGKDRCISADKDLPATPFQLGAVLFISNQKVDNAGLEHLKGLTNLRHLDLTETHVSDAGLEHLKGLTNLTVLRLNNTPVSDAGLVHLKGLTNLTRLGLSNTQVSGAGLVHLKGPTNLTHLDLSWTPVNDTGLEHLKGLTNLTDLNLGFSPVSGAGLVHLKGLTNLTILGLYNTRVSDTGLEHLKGLTNLTSLNLGETQVNGAGLVHLKGLTNLTNLTLLRTQVSGAGLEHLKGLTNLAFLDLFGTPVSDAGLEHFEGPTSLTHLHMDWTQVTDVGLEHLKGLTNLTELRLKGTRVSGAGFEHLKGLTNLTLLDLRFAQVTDSGLEQLKWLTNLTTLHLGDTRVGDAGLMHLNRLTKLGSLELNRTRVSDAGLRSLANLPLRQIYLDYSRASAGGFSYLKNALPKAEIFGEPRPSLAQELLDAGATLAIRAGAGKADRLAKRYADLPRESFLVRQVDCAGVKKPLAELLARLSRCREYEFEGLEALDLSGCAIDNLGFAPPLENLQELTVSGTKVADLQPLLGLKHLCKLSLDRTPVSNLGPIADVTELEELSLAGTPIADTALQALENLPNLRKLDLNQTGVTGRGVDYLVKLPKLADLSLIGTQVTADGVAVLQKALPKCKIVFGPAPK